MIVLAFVRKNKSVDDSNQLRNLSFFYG